MCSCINWPESGFNFTCALSSLRVYCNLIKLMLGILRFDTKEGMRYISFSLGCLWWGDIGVASVPDYQLYWFSCSPSCYCNGTKSLESAHIWQVIWRVSLKWWEDKLEASSGYILLLVDFHFDCALSWHFLEEDHYWIGFLIPIPFATNIASVLFNPKNMH